MTEPHPAGYRRQALRCDVDLRLRCALYLTYHRYGDTRKRSMAMPRSKAAY